MPPGLGWAGGRGEGCQGSALADFAAQREPRSFPTLLAALRRLRRSPTHQPSWPAFDQVAVSDRWIDFSAICFGTLLDLMVGEIHI
jgi:hypothetical protein